jgi:hypothetical protein
MSGWTAVVLGYAVTVALWAGLAWWSGRRSSG